MRASAGRFTRTVRVVDAYPEIAARLDSRNENLARGNLVAALLDVGPGEWRPDRTMQREPGHLGLLVLDGLLMRNVVLGDTLATELVGRGDLLRPADHDGEDAPIPFDVVWHVLLPARIAVLDRQFAATAGHWPAVIEVLVRGAVRRAQSLAFTLAASHVRPLTHRLHVTMWHLADRYGTVGPEGVHVPLKLTHEMLARLIGARRPSVTTSLGQLSDEGLLTRTDDGTWLLHGDPPETVSSLRSEPALSRG